MPETDTPGRPIQTACVTDGASDGGSETTAMRLTCGVDIVAVDRVDALIEEFGESVVDRLFTTAEVRYCREQTDTAQSFAARWAAKEATMKALPPLSRSVSFDDVGVRKAEHGAPKLDLAAWVTEQFAHPPATAVSLSHDRHSGTAAAQVLLMSDRACAATEVSA